jgi:hypothetical protein
VAPREYACVPRTPSVPCVAVRALGEVCSRLARRAIAVAETRRGVAIVFVAALALWWLEALILPLGGGRDLFTYLGAYAQLFQHHPIDLGYTLDRMPIASLVVGGLLDAARGALAEPVVSLLYAGSVAAWFLAARMFSARAAVLAVVVLFLYPGYGILFHELSSDMLFAAGFAGWSLLAVRTFLRPTVPAFAGLGTGVGALALIRPANQALAVLALVTLALAVRWRARIAYTAAFLAPVLVVVGGWTIQNGLRYGDYVFARGGNATVPFYRTFVTDKIVRSTNGPASQMLARDVHRYLLPYEPYRSYHITLHDFFTRASPRMQTDLVALSDRLKGFDTNDAWLRTIGLEAVRTHPSEYSRGVASSVWGLLRNGLYWIPSSPAPPVRGVATNESTATPGGPTVVVGGRRLPLPTEGEPIPAPHEGGVATPDHSIYTVWTSPTRRHLVFVHTGAKQRYVALHIRMSVLGSHLPDRAGEPSLAHRLNQASRWFPPPFLWLLLAIGAFAFRRPRNALAMWFPALAALVVVFVSALGLPAEPHYSVPAAPAFVLAALAGLFAARREPALAWAGVPQLRSALGIGVGLIALLWAAVIYRANLNGDVGVGHDLAVFLSAASRLTAGASPYAYSGDRTFAYPPLLGFLAEPFNALGASVAAIAWPAALLCAIAIALWMLGVRDWRCYALAAVYPMTRSCIDLGTVGPFLLLGVAVAWRWREHVLRSAVGLGAAIAVKLYLWPLLIWAAAMRRFRAMVGAAVFGAACLLVPWAAVGFAGLGRYPGLLHRLSHHEASSSYSVIALGVRAHLPETVAFVISLLVAAGLLAAAVWLARQDSVALRERDVAVLTLTLAAALAASPIVWMHYFLLLLVPLALARPRLSWLWFVPFAYYPLGEAAWPAGDARKLGIALATTLVLLIGSLFETLRATNRRPVRSVAASPVRWPIASPSAARDNVTRTGSR